MPGAIRHAVPCPVLSDQNHTLTLDPFADAEVDALIVLVVVQSEVVA